MRRKMLIIGNGPSTKSLAEIGFENLPADIDTFGMGAAYRYFQRIDWWPTYFACCDQKVVFSHMAPLARLTYESCRVERFYFPIKVSPSPRVTVVPHAPTGDFCLLEAVRLGYTMIYLIGIEADYVEEIAECRTMERDEREQFGAPFLSLSNRSKRNLRVITRTPDRNPNYFFDDYQQAGDVYSLPRAHAHQKRWEVAAQFAKSHGATVLNLSSASKVAAFPKVAMSDILGLAGTSTVTT